MLLSRYPHRAWQQGSDGEWRRLMTTPAPLVDFKVQQMWDSISTSSQASRRTAPQDLSARLLIRALSTTQRLPRVVDSLLPQ